VNIEYTNTDGWDCEPKLMQVVKKLKELGEDNYEIQYCVRQSNLKNMVNHMEEVLTEALEIVKEIAVETEYITKEEI